MIQLQFHAQPTSSIAPTSLLLSSSLSSSLLWKPLLVAVVISRLCGFGCTFLLFLVEVFFLFMVKIETGNYPWRLITVIKSQVVIHVWREDRILWYKPHFLHQNWGKRLAMAQFHMQIFVKASIEQTFPNQCRCVLRMRLAYTLDFTGIHD